MKVHLVGFQPDEPTSHFIILDLDIDELEEEVKALFAFGFTILHISPRLLERVWLNQTEEE